MKKHIQYLTFGSKEMLQKTPQQDLEALYEETNTVFGKSIPCNAPKDNGSATFQLSILIR